MSAAVPVEPVNSSRPYSCGAHILQAITPLRELGGSGHARLSSSYSSHQLLYFLDYFTQHLATSRWLCWCNIFRFSESLWLGPHQHYRFRNFFGVHGKILQCIKDFPINRTQQVVLNGQKSGLIPVTSDVPQGSMLCPHLFTILVNDIPSVVSSPTFMFADHMKIYLYIRSSDHATL